MDLVLVPARGGSKGIPGKNIKPLAGRPLLWYTLDVAVALGDDRLICVSTDDAAIADSVHQYGLMIDFTRPAELSTDTAGSREVILHAIDFYRHSRGIDFERIILLQPTSPLRQLFHVEEALKLYSPDIDMVVSVTRSAHNPWHNLFIETSGGYMRRAVETGFGRRQDCPVVYELNGAIYIINPLSVRQKDLSQFERIVKYEMPRKLSVDIDDESDWKLAEIMLTDL
jgi:N-acylneuraminate cytidylyltransferase